MNVVSAIVSNVEGSFPIHHFYDCIADFSSCLLGFRCSFVRRFGNTLAHLVARWDTGLTKEKICTDPFPQVLLTLAKDGNGYWTRSESMDPYPFSRI